MTSSSAPEPMPQGFVLSFDHADLIMTPEGSAIAFGDDKPFSLQNLN